MSTKETLDERMILDVGHRLVWRNRASDGYAWWLARAWSVFPGQSVQLAALNKISSFFVGEVEIEVSTDEGPEGSETVVEIVVWVRKKLPGQENYSSL